MKRHVVSLLLVSSVALSACMTPPSEAGLQPWDQAQVTLLSRKLLAGANAWFLTLIQQGHGSGRLQMNARAIQDQAATLAAHLEAGQGFQQTVYDYRDLREMLDDADVGVDSRFIEEPTNLAWERMIGPMREITPYYDARKFEH